MDKIQPTIIHGIMRLAGFPVTRVKFACVILSSIICHISGTIKPAGIAMSNDQYHFIPNDKTEKKYVNIVTIRSEIMMGTLLKYAGRFICAYDFTIECSAHPLVATIIANIASAIFIYN